MGVGQGNKNLGGISAASLGQGGTAHLPPHSAVSAVPSNVTGPVYHHPTPPFVPPQSQSYSPYDMGEDAYGKDLALLSGQLLS